MKKTQPEIIKTIELLKGIKRNLERGKDYDDFILDEKISTRVKSKTKKNIIPKN